MWTVVTGHCKISVDSGSWNLELWNIDTAQHRHK
jgi:hypothetical protein